MSLRVHSHSEYFLVGTCYSVGKLPLRITQAALSLISLGSGAVIAERFLKSNLPTWAYPVSYCTAGASLLAMAATFAFRKKPPLKVMESVTLLTPKEVKSFKASPHIHELCEIRIDGSTQEISLERLQQILDELTEKKSIHVINSVPEQFMALGRLNEKINFIPFSYNIVANIVAQTL